ncbi:hypothetical protein ACIP9C_11440 [Lysinibacillus sp. NPDC093210]|uniref:hypothetical protein n=1 Tax=Lysinibacillus sp. NPDC093210 TaxID=3364133 RepID=UPI003811B5A8
MKEGKLKAAKEQPKMFLKSIQLEKKDELESLRKKFRPYDALKTRYSLYNECLVICLLLQEYQN